MGSLSKYRQEDPVLIPGCVWGVGCVGLDECSCGCTIVECLGGQTINLQLKKNDLGEVTYRK